MSERVYWDSCVFLALLKGEPGRRNVCQALAETAEAGELTIVTSSATLIEVITLGEKLNALTEETEVTIRQFFLNEWIEVVQLDRLVGELARDLIWKNKLSKLDAVHVATAVIERVPLLETYDENLIDQLGGAVTHREVLIELRKPHMAQVPVLRPEAA